MTGKTKKPSQANRVKTRTVYQHSETGQYVSKAYAMAHKDITFSHKIKTAS